MTKRFVTGLALLLLLQLSAGLVISSSTIGWIDGRIVEDTTWSDAATIDGRVEVASGATLTISAPHEMAEGASLDIEAGGSVIVQSDLTSDGMRSGLLWSENGSLHIPTPQGHSGGPRCDDPSRLNGRSGQPHLGRSRRDTTARDGRFGLVDDRLTGSERDVARPHAESSVAEMGHACRADPEHATTRCSRTRA